MEIGKGIEGGLEDFEKEFRSCQRNYQENLNLSNLIIRHLNTADCLKNNDDFIVVEVDKDLGGSVLNRAASTT